MSITILITAYKEAATIGQAMEAFLAQMPDDAELLVVCPDAETTAVVRQYASSYSQIRHIQDPGVGKPAALNVGLAEAMGDIVVLSDGDIVVAKDALAPLLAPFADDSVGAVTGHPLSSSPRSTKLGYWSHLLTEGAHQERLRRDTSGAFLLCSGYLFAYRKALIDHVPEDALAEDAVISHRIAEQGYRIRYAPEAQVNIKYPTTYRDWLVQKVRSAGGYAQDHVRNSPYQMRSAKLEAVHGTKLALSYARNLREFGWTLQLFAARLQLWSLVFWQVRVKKRPLSELWQRVETTK